MGFRIVIAGQSQNNQFDQICFVADHLAINLPDFCYNRIEKPVIEWEEWICKVNQKNKWHHEGCVVVWKELLMQGSKPYYIGGASEFLEYCHSYYQLDLFMTNEKFKDIVQNFSQFKTKLKNEKLLLQQSINFSKTNEVPPKNDFVVCISGVGVPLAMHIISGLLHMVVGEKYISKIYIYDNDCSHDFLKFVEDECNYVRANNPKKVVKVIDKLGIGLTHADLLIILNHVPFEPDMAMGDWLISNKKVMHKLALIINAAASRKMCILFPNLGPACYNATVLMNLTNSINKRDIVVATSDLGLEVSAFMAEIAEVPLRNMFCPPVWGFVGINHLVDIRTTIHKYNSFEPYTRYTKVKNSSLTIGSLTPEMRTMEYLLYFDESLWSKVVENKSKITKGHIPFNKAQAVLNLIDVWFINPNETNIVNLGLLCNGSFGLTFEGAFSQPSKLFDGHWVPAKDFLMPRDPQMKLNYLENMANLSMNLGKGDMPNIIPLYPCYCKPKVYRKKQVW